VISVTCIICGKELDEPGAILLSPPMHEHGGGSDVKYYKWHLCPKHYETVMTFIQKEQL